MTYTKRTPCYDADSHIMEMGDWIGRYADPDIRDRLKPIDLGLAGGGIPKSVLDKLERRRRDPEAMKVAEETVMTAKAWLALGSAMPASAAGSWTSSGSTPRSSSAP